MNGGPGNALGAKSAELFPHFGNYTFTSGQWHTGVKVSWNTPERTGTLFRGPEI